MVNSRYINSLLSLRRILNDRIDNEIEDTLRGREDPEHIIESLRYQIEERSPFLINDCKDK